MRGGWYFVLFGDADPPSAGVDEAPVPVDVFEPFGLPISGLVTHYGPRYNGSSLGCGTGVYTSGNPEIIAVGPARYREWPCGTVLQVCGPVGCIQGTRMDGCPGCGPNLLDLSEAGIALVCSDQAHVCGVQIQRLQKSP